jgi:Cu/Ag efflux protein CusF
MRLPRGVRRVTTAAAIASAAFMLPALPAQQALAQTNPTLKNVVPESAAMTLHARILSINPKTRELVLEDASGATVRVTAGPLVRLNLLKAGDTVNAKYYRSVAFELTMPESSGGGPAPQSSVKGVAIGSATAPGGFAVRETKVSGLVVGIDLAAHSVNIVSPSGGGVYTVEVTDPARIAQLAKLKVGDTVTAVVNEALAVEITPAPQSYFPPASSTGSGNGGQGGRGGR